MKPNRFLQRALPLTALFLLACPGARAQHEGHNMPGMPSPPAPAPAPAPAPRSTAPDMQPQGRTMPGMPSAPTGSPPTGTQSRSDPNTPRPPENTSGPTSMPVSDNMISHQFLLDELEYTRARRGGSGLAWDFHGWVGSDYNRLWIKSDGERQGGRTEDGRLDLLYGRPIAAFWDLQAGIRHDFGEGPRRNWLALGIQGVAPYWFDLEGTLYVGSSGRTALRLNSEYQFVLTQRTFLVQEVEANFYGKSDRARGIGSGLSDLEVGLRLRYEFRREFAPYIGVTWRRSFGGTADLARAAGDRVSQTQFVAGVRVWY